MRAQVIQFGVDASSLEEVQGIISRWAEGPGVRLSGCKQVTVSCEAGGLNRVSVVVAFDDQQALDRFSEDLETQELFERAKPYIRGKLELFEASLDQQSLA